MRVLGWTVLAGGMTDTARDDEHTVNMYIRGFAGSALREPTRGRGPQLATAGGEAGVGAGESLGSWRYETRTVPMQQSGMGSPSLCLS